MSMPLPLRKKFNIAAIKTKGITLLIAHGPCCILALVGGLVGVSLFNHNPFVELGLALSGAVAGEYLGHKHFGKKHCHDHRSQHWLRRYSVSLALGLIVWGAHQIFLHDNHDHDHFYDHRTHVEGQTLEEICRTHNHDHGNQPSFAPPQVRQMMDNAHNRLHERCANIGVPISP